jgi:dipeptidyl aminopeptidase/acylaminoacyl peptidase
MPLSSRTVAPVVLFLSAIASPVVFAQAARPEPVKPLTPEFALTLRSLSGLQFSPDGSRLTFVVQEPPKGDVRARHIWMLEVPARVVRQFTYSAKSEFEPRWSPDGKLLAFLSNREEHNQIYLMRASQGEAWPLTRGKRSVSTFRWSPDGSQIAFLAPDAKTEAEEKKQKDKDDARVVDKDDKHARLWLVNASTGEVRALTPVNWRVTELEWLPQGDQLIVSATDHPESDQETNRIFAVAVRDGAMKPIAAPSGPFSHLRVSPDGKAVSYIGCRVDGPIPHDLFVQPLSGGAPRNLTAAGVDRPILDYRWRQDGSLLIVIADGFKTRLVGFTQEGVRTDLAGPAINPDPVEISSTGQVAFVGQAATEPEELYLWDTKTPAQRVSNVNETWRQVALAKPEFYRYKSFDGQEIEAAILKSKEYDGNTKLPLIALIHGGPTGNWRDRIEPWGQLLAARGYAIFYPNIRGSIGYGQQFMEMNRADWGGGDFKDVMAGIDDLVARGIVDPDRLGIGGWSYGGYMSEWAITQTTRFKAAVSGAGMANLISEFGTEEHPAYDEWFWGLPYEHSEGFLKASPFLYLRRARTPTLILQGDADLIDPLGQGQELYRGLKRYGVEAELVVYPREPHGLREEKHLLDRLNRILAWYDKHLKN